jgi:uncharacterized membrane protein
MAGANRRARRKAKSVDRHAKKKNDPVAIFTMIAVVAVMVAILGVAFALQ